VDRAPCLVESCAIAVEQKLGVGLGEHCVDLEGELLDARVGVKLISPFRLAYGRRDQLRPVGLDLGDAIAYRARPGVKLGGNRREEATAGEDQTLDVREEALAEHLETGKAVFDFESRVDDVGVEHLLGGGDRRELQLLFRAEVCIHTALAHTDGVDEPSDRKAVDAFDRRQASSRIKDRAPAPLAICSAPALPNLAFDTEPVHVEQISTTVRSLNLLCKCVKLAE